MAPIRGDVAPVYSQVAGPIGNLSFLRRSLMFAELSQVCYLSRAEAGRLAFRIGFPEIRYYDRDGTGVYLRQPARPRGGLSRYRAERLERHQGGLGPVDCHRGNGGSGTPRLQARGGRSLAAAGTGAQEQHVAALVHGAFAGRRDGHDLRKPLPPVLHQLESAGVVHVR